MKTVRFSNVVQKAGQPETHLVLVEPSKDRALQAAIKAGRVMTVRQETAGAKTDRGEIGFQAGTSRQFLVFPKSLRSFSGRTVVGIKYDLLRSENIPKSERAAAPRPPKPRKTAPAIASNTVSPSVPKMPRRKPSNRVASNVVPFEDPPKTSRAVEPENDELTEFKKEARRAMDLLEDGKVVAAFNLLKRISQF